ncbi:MAG: hypothetical protein QNJ91_07150 [Gammaproteobacteria bacterium]|nr:hypothetical protein [Gammaproteobacteria bacterium]
MRVGIPVPVFGSTIASLRFATLFDHLHGWYDSVAQMSDRTAKFPANP